MFKSLNIFKYNASVAEAYSEPYQTSKIEQFAKCSILGVWQGSEYTSRLKYQK